MGTEINTVSEVIPKKYIRLGLFIEQLINNNKKFDNPEEANLYLQEVLKEIEDELVPDGGLRIRVFSLRFFDYAESCRIWTYETLAHCIAIHTNGSYGIYELKNRIFRWIVCNFINKVLQNL